MSQTEIVPKLDLGECAGMDDDEAEGFEEALMEEFASSDEARTECARVAVLQWAGITMQVARMYEGLRLTEMGPADLRFVLLRTFARKVSCEPSAAREILEELRAFYAFLRRRFALPQAEACRAALDGGMLGEMERELGNPANFGPAKSFFMAGRRAGFDVATEEGVSAWQAFYNSRSAAAREPSSLSGGGQPALSFRRPPLTKAERNKKKAQRRAARATSGGRSRATRRRGG